MAKTSYGEQLRHPNWQRKRLEILQRDEFTCQACHDSESTLHVHHRRYIKGNKVWEYDDNDLVTLCEECHEDAHAKDARLSYIYTFTRVDGPVSDCEANAILAGWVSRGRRLDALFEHEERDNAQTFVIGEIAAEMSGHFSTDVEQLRRLRDALAEIPYRKFGDAIDAMIKAIER